MKTFFLTLFTLLLQACSTSSETHIQQSELLTLLQSEQAPIIIDVRSSREFNAGHLPHAQHIPFWQSFTTDALENNEKQDDLILYCEFEIETGYILVSTYVYGTHLGYKSIIFDESK